MCSGLLEVRVAFFLLKMVSDVCIGERFCKYVSSFEEFCEMCGIVYSFVGFCVLFVALYEVLQSLVVLISLFCVRFCFFVSCSRRV